MAQVKIIAPQTREAEHLRVAAYCRVSSDSKDQLHSYAAQIRSYTEEIAQHDGWELVDVYADEGLTGTRMDRREDRIPLRPEYQRLPVRPAGVIHHGRQRPV